MPRPRRGKGAAATGSSGETPHEKDATASSGGVPMVHQGVAASGLVLVSVSVSTPGMMQKEAAAAAFSGVAPTMDPGKGSAISDSIEGMPQKRAAAAAPSGVVATMDLWKGPAGSDSTEEDDPWIVAASRGRSAASVALHGNTTAQDCEESATKHPAKKARTVSCVIIPHEHCTEDEDDMGVNLSGSDSSDGKLQKKAVAASRGGSAASGALHGNTTAQDCEGSAAKHHTKKAHTVSTANIPHEHYTEDEGDMGLSPKVEADTGLALDMLHKHAAEEADTAKDIQESDSDETVHVKEEDTHAQEAERLIQKMDACGIGESISPKEFQCYVDQMPSAPRWIDLADRLKDEEIDDIKVRHALYRFRYLKNKFLEQASTEELQDDRLKSLLDKSEQDCTQDFLEEEGFFRHFEDDYTLDWFFHRDYLKCSSLNDYQRLVLQNYGGTEYSRWSEYHQFRYSHKIEKEYVKYYEELSKKLKWMESYLETDQTDVEWECISSRGALQAIKIAATGFHEISPGLAYIGFHECQESMLYDINWFKELDGVYFEIWRRVTQPMSFKDALKEVYKLDKFPVRQRLMKAALEDDYTMKWMEEEFETCMSAITSEEKKNEVKELITQDKAKELIEAAVKKLVVKPKNYDQYISKKIHIAKFLGILSPED